MEPPLSTLPIKVSNSGSGSSTRNSTLPPSSPSASTRSKRPKLASPLSLLTSSLPRHPSTLRSAQSRKASGSGSVRGGLVASMSSAGGSATRKGKARLMMEEEEQMDLKRLVPGEDGDDEDEDEYVWDLVGIERDEAETQIFLFLAEAYVAMKESLIARVVDPFVDYAEDKTVPTSPPLSALTAPLAPLLAYLKPLLLRRTLDVLKDGDEDLYRFNSPICTEEMMDREEFIYAPLRFLLQVLLQREHSAFSRLNGHSATPGPKGKTFGNVRNAMGWVLLRIGQRGLEDPRWERKLKGREGGEGAVVVERVGKRRTMWDEEDGLSEDSEERLQEEP